MLFSALISVIFWYVFWYYYFFCNIYPFFICIYFGGDKYLYTYKKTCYSFRVKMWSLEALLQAKISTQINFCQNKKKKLRKNIWLQCSWLSKIFLQTNECQNNSCIIILKRRTVNLSQYLFLMRTFLVFKCCHCTLYIYFLLCCFKQFRHVPIDSSACKLSKFIDYFVL